MTELETTTAGTKTLQTGVYLIEAACPRCGAIEEVLVSIRAVVTIPEADLGKLAVRLKGKARDHDCRQVRMVVNADTGEVLQ